MKKNKYEGTNVKMSKKPTVSQVTFDRKHPNCGTVFTLRWDFLKKLIEKDFKGKTDRVVSFRFDEYGLTIYLDTNDCSAHTPMKIQGND
jgi:hypothetical protein